MVRGKLMGEEGEQTIKKDPYFNKTIHHHIRIMPPLDRRCTMFGHMLFSIGLLHGEGQQRSLTSYYICNSYLQ